MSDSQVAILVEGLTKSFRRVVLRQNYSTFKSLILRPFKGRSDGRPTSTEVLKGVDLEVRAGQMVGLIGRNGSGKSTLLKIMAGIYKPGRGKVKLTGRVSSLIELGAGFHPEFSGRENVFLNGAILGMSKEELNDKFDDIVRFAELEEFIDAPVRTYSSGMYVRLGFSVAVNVDPDILLVDEVLAVGDEAFAHKCETKIGEFKRAGKTIVLVTHDLGAVEEYCDTAIWLEGGKIAARGRPLEVIDAYRQFVAAREDQALQARLEENQRLAQLEAEQQTEDETPEGGPDLAGETAQAQDEKTRWGDGRARFKSVAVLADSGQGRSVFRPEDGLKIALDYKLEPGLEDVVFGVAINKNQGDIVYGTNTHIDRIKWDQLPREGRIEFEIDKLNLVDGTYLIDAAIHAKDGRAYDYWTRCATFVLRSGAGDAGVYRPRHGWKLPG